MGGGSWNLNDYERTYRAAAASGSTFDYDRKVKATREYKAHESLDPSKRNANGELIRESRDSAEHPTSVPIVVGFDSTGSMRDIPRIAQKNLGKLFQLLLDKNYVEHPQVAITSYGDAYTDHVPFQISQFESDNRIDVNLDNLFLEGNGGGNDGETQALLWYFLANHVVTDAYLERGKKGYLFIIADEISHPITAAQVKQHLGVSDDEIRTSDLQIESLVAHLKTMWDVYILFEDNWSAKRQGSREFYTKLFGKDHLIEVENYETVAEVIGGAIGYLEQKADEQKLEEDLASVGASAASVARTTKALANIQRPSAAVASEVELYEDDEDVATL